MMPGRHVDWHRVRILLVIGLFYLLFWGRIMDMWVNGILAGHWFFDVVTYILLALVLSFYLAWMVGKLPRSDRVPPIKGIGIAIEVVVLFYALMTFLYC